MVQWVGLRAFTAVSPGSIPGLPESQAVWLKKKKKKKTRKNCSLSFFSFTLGKLMRDLEYKTSEYLQGIVAEVSSFPVKVRYSQVSISVLKREVFVWLMYPNSLS